jgi:putative hemolysin
MIACCRWNEKPSVEKTWTHFKSHFAAAHRQHKQMKGETAAHAGFNSSNAAMNQTEDHMAEATTGDLANLATTTATDRGVVALLTQANYRLVKQLEETSSELRDLKAMVHQERRDRRVPINFSATASTYCWTHGYKVDKTHTSLSCNTPNPGHKTEATRADNMGGSQANKERYVGAATLNNKTTFEVCQTPPLLEQHRTACLNKVIYRNPLAVRLPNGATMEPLTLLTWTSPN